MISRVAVKGEPLANSLVIVQLVGYPLITLLAATSGVPSRPGSVAMRAFVLGCSILAIALWGRRFSRAPTWVSLGFLLFWGTSVWRFADQALPGAEPLFRPWYDYWAFGLGACAIPALAAFVIPTGRLRFRIPVLGLAIAVALLGNAALAFSEAGSELLRLRHGSLNPIPFGHLAGMAVIVGLCSLPAPKSTFGRIFWTALVSLGGVTIVATGSRGPIVALAAVVLVWFGHRVFTVGLNRGTVVATMAAVLGLGWFVANTIPRLDPIVQARLAEPFSEQISGNDLADRLPLWSESFRATSDGPILGVGLVLPGTTQYPHNLLVEALLATGVLGLTGLLLVLLFALQGAWVLVREGSGDMVWALLLLQSLLGALFSGSIYLNPVLWLLMLLVPSMAKDMKQEMEHGEVQAAAVTPEGGWVA
jgi:O-antigen ligase